MALKVNMLINGITTAGVVSAPGINYLSQKHAYGFSEGFWYDGDDDTTFRNKLQQLALKRAVLLPSGSTLIGARVYRGGTGASKYVPLNLNGPSGQTTDQVNVAILCKTQLDANPTQREWWLHTVPDDQVTGGEFTPTGGFATFVQAYFAELASGQVRYPATTKTSLASVHDVLNSGLVTLNAASVYAVGQIVSIRRTLDATGRRRGGDYFVQSVGPLSNQFTLGSWQWGNTKGGSAFIGVKTLVPFGAAGQMPLVRRAGTRKVGRPFDLYTGRRSPKR